MARHTDKVAISSISRRAILKGLATAPVLFRPAPFFAASISPDPPSLYDPSSALPFSDTRFVPHYPSRSPLADVIGLVAPGSDEYASEKYAVEIESILTRWSAELRESPRKVSALGEFLDSAMQGSALIVSSEKTVRSAYGIEVVHRQFAPDLLPGRDRCLKSIDGWLEPITQIETAEFEIYSISEIAQSPHAVRLELRYDLVANRRDGRREERVGSWRMEWYQDASQAWLARRWEASDET